MKADGTKIMKQKPKPINREVPNQEASSHEALSREVPTQEMSTQETPSREMSTQEVLKQISSPDPEGISKAERRRLLRIERAGQKKAEAALAQEEEQKRHVRFMKEAMRQAKKAEALGEVPIGCVIVRDGKIIGRGYNRRNTDHTTLSHAEITAIKKACKVTGDWRLEDCDLYVTLEPCPMCAGAILQSRMKRVILACYNPKAGCAGSILNVLQMKEFNHRVEIVDRVMEEECSEMLKGYFRSLRIRVKQERETDPEKQDRKKC